MRTRSRANDAPKRPPSLDDAWCDKTSERVALAMVEWLKGSLNVKRVICTMTKDEMKRLARCATDQWIICASERVAEAPADNAELAAFLG